MTVKETEHWAFLVDRGGTFTDCIGVEPKTGRHHVAKVLSSDDAPLIAIRKILKLPDGAPIPPCDVRMGTTVATNALLERKGASTLLVITRGFSDLLQIGDQTRPDLFALQIDKSRPLYREVIEVSARCDADGNAIEEPDETDVKQRLGEARERGLRSVAIVVLHAYRAPLLERRLSLWAREVGFEHVTASHEVARELGFLKRGQTAVLDAYLTPLLAAYLRQLAESLPGSRLLLMQSSGDLSAPEHFRGPAALLSGPAGGVVAAAHVAREAGFQTAVGFDMGGTSTDVARYSGRFARIYETRVANTQVMAPMLEIHTIAAGGGSLCRYDGHTLRVGPESAGATPGPLCYGHPEACELTITDINLLLGRLQPHRFPFELELARARRALERLRQQLLEDSQDLDATRLAAGFLAIANENMAHAISRVTLERGHDMRADALVVYGGAAGQHACAVACLLGIRHLLFHPFAGVLSAYGMGLADLGWHGEREVGRPHLSAATLVGFEPIFTELEREAASVLAGQLDAATSDSAASSGLVLTRRLDLRYQGTEASLTVDLGSQDAVKLRFTEAHQRRFGYVQAGRALIVTAVRIEARVSPKSTALELEVAAPDRALPVEVQRTRIYCTDRFIDNVPVFARETLLFGHTLQGPACIVEDTGTIVLDPGFSLRVGPGGVLHVTQTQQVARSIATTRSSPDPITLRLMSNAFMSIAEQMGTVLRSTARSTNIRERLDFSCALFDKDSNLVANAPHIPVHLGAMSESVAEVKKAFPAPKPGDVFVTNDPEHGGSHLPDITVITPVFDGDDLLFFTASRGHHADIGGISPGSMPAFSRRLDEEGVVLVAQHLVRDGQFLEDELLRKLKHAPYPARDPEQNLADLKAQIAANQQGARALKRLLEERGRQLVLAYLEYVQDDASRWVKERLTVLTTEPVEFEDSLDDGTPIGVRLCKRADQFEVDFSCGPESDGNANAPRAITTAAVLYVLRCLADEALPLNAGCLRQIAIRIPEHSLLNPSPGRAVVSGNVETSQRIVDVLLAALGKLAASQGTMNNITFGNSEFAYYETLGGGSGAGPDFAGQSAVQCHMTNTRITDVEVLEATAPVRVRCFALRPGSGGSGRYPGGDGLVRELEFLAPLSLSIVSERRVIAPFGLRGGQAGRCGVNTLNGQPLPGRYAGTVQKHDVLRIETPGGGGYGAAAARCPIA